MNKEKPPVLSNTELHVFNPAYTEFAQRIAQAQYNALVAYYEPLIQQAKEEVAREIREGLGKEFPEVLQVEPIGSYDDTVKRLSEKAKKWQAFWDKRLKG